MGRRVSLKRNALRSMERETSKYLSEATAALEADRQAAWARKESNRAREESDAAVNQRQLAGLAASFAPKRASLDTRIEPQVPRLGARRTLGTSTPSRGA